MESAVDIISKLGTPIGVLVLIVMMLYKLAQWAQPKVDMLINSHMELLHELKKTNAANSESLKATADSLEKLTEIVQSQNGH